MRPFDSCRQRFSRSTLVRGANHESLGLKASTTGHEKRYLQEVLASPSNSMGDTAVVYRCDHPPPIIPSTNTESTIEPAAACKYNLLTNSIYIYECPRRLRVHKQIRVLSEGRSKHAVGSTSYTPRAKKRTYSPRTRRVCRSVAARRGSEKLWDDFASYPDHTSRIKCEAVLR